MRRADPPPTREEALELMRGWLEDGEGLERIRRAMPPGATREDALALRRRLKQLRRRPSRCMQGDDAP